MILSHFSPEGQGASAFSKMREILIMALEFVQNIYAMKTHTTGTLLGNFTYVKKCKSDPSIRV